MYAINQMPAEAGAKVLLVWTAAVAVLYPYNAKFGYLSKIEPKYPMHYVPEVLMPTLVAMGIISLLEVMRSTNEICAGSAAASSGQPRVQKCANLVRAPI